MKNQGTNGLRLKEGKRLLKKVCTAIFQNMVKRILNNSVCCIRLSPSVEVQADCLNYNYFFLLIYGPFFGEFGSIYIFLEIF
jgi:hypothetical protein